MYANKPYLSLDKWKINENYEIIKIIGQGAYGDVAEGIYKATNSKVAIKKFYNIYANKN